MKSELITWGDEMYLVMKNLWGKLEADIIIKGASDCLISYATVLGLSRETVYILMQLWRQANDNVFVVCL